MKMETAIEQLLRWRQARAEAAAPPAPSAERLLELVRPWWETWPERFQEVATRLFRIQVAYGHAMVDPKRARGGHPVPVVVVRAAGDVESSARILYVRVDGDRLLLRFQLDPGAGPAQEPFEVTLVDADRALPLLTTTANPSVDHEYHVDVPLPVQLAEAWRTLKVADRMPFRFILRPGEGNTSP